MALCQVVVDARTYINGQGNDRPILTDPSRIPTQRGTPIPVNVDGSTAEASWNKNPKSLHADSSLGTLARSGACWGNATTQICARDLPAVK